MFLLKSSSRKHQVLGVPMPGLSGMEWSRLIGEQALPLVAMGHEERAVDVNSPLRRFNLPLGVDKNNSVPGYCLLTSLTLDSKCQNLPQQAYG